MPEAETLFDATKLLASGGFAITLIVQIVKMAAEGALTARVTVLVALVSGALMTALFVVSNNAFSVAASFDIFIAWIVLTAVGSGIHSLVTASIKPSPPSP